MGGFAGRDGARPRARGGLRGAGAASRRPGWQAAAAAAAVGAVAAFFLALIGSPSEAFAAERQRPTSKSAPKRGHSSLRIATKSEAEEIKTEESLEFPAEEGMDLSSSACKDSGEGL